MYDWNALLLSFFCESPDGRSSAPGSRVISINFVENFTFREFARVPFLPASFVQEGRGFTLATAEEDGAKSAVVFD